MIFQLLTDHEQVVVLFRLPAQIWADTIHLVGDFNGWSTSATPMRLGEQYWEARLVLPIGGHYFYAYLVDGQDWCTESDSWLHGGDAGALPVTLLPVEIPQAQRRIAVRG
jgi:hypothetical protein